MDKKIKPALAACYPTLWRWITEFGQLEIGYCYETRSFIRLLDEGGMIWHGRRSYRSFDAALADAEAGAAQWMKSELGITEPDDQR